MVLHLVVEGKFLLIFNKRTGREIGDFYDFRRKRGVAKIHSAWNEEKNLRTASGGMQLAQKFSIGDKSRLRSPTPASVQLGQSHTLQMRRNALAEPRATDQRKVPSPFP